jgi:Tol biopolymer transport system component
VENVAANVDFGGGQYDFSQTGTFVCRTGQASVAAWPVLWMDSSGQTQPLIRTPAHYRSPRFSPDGKRLAVAVGYSESEIWVYDLQREAATKLTFTGRNQYPVWTPGGKHIVYQSQLEHSIMWMRADGAGEPHRLLEGIQVKLPYSFSPDGRRLAFSEMAGGSGFDLWTLPLDLTDPDHPKPGKPELFLGTSASENYPALSPDGQWMAYQSNESGIPEIYVRPFAAGSSPGGGKWQISTGGGAFPIWSRAGRQLLYRSEDGHVMMIDYTASGDSFRPDKPRRWADRLLWGYGIYPSFDLAPDGKRVAMLPLAEETDAKGNLHVTMLLNFFDEVRRRVSARSE